MNSLSTQLTPQRQVELLWSELRSVDKSLWKILEPGTKRDGRRREGFELLISVAWHLELAAALGPLSTQKAVAYRVDSYAVDELLPWGKWLEQRQSVDFSESTNSLQLAYRFSAAPDPRCAYVLQATMIGDAAMRIVSIADVLRDDVPSPRSALFTRGARNWEALEPQLTNTDIHMSALVIAFRDAYAHAEYSDDVESRHRLLTFRNSLHHNYGLADLFGACIWGCNVLRAAID